MSKTVTLGQAARVLRSKNSGPFSITLDVLFDDEALYGAVKAQQTISKQVIARLYHLAEEDVSDVVYFDRALGLKVTIARHVSSGSPLDTDVYGAQHHAPLLGLTFDPEA